MTQIPTPEALEFKKDEVVGYIAKDRSMSLYFIDKMMGVSTAMVVKMNYDGGKGKQKFETARNKLRKIWLQIGDKVRDTKKAKAGKVVGFTTIVQEMPYQTKPPRGSVPVKKYTNCFVVDYEDHTEDYISFEDAAMQLEFHDK